MTVRQIFKILAICCVPLVIILFAVWVARVPRTIVIVGRAENKCKNIGFLLKKFYAKSDIMTKEPNQTHVPDVIKFLEEQRNILALGISSQSPVTPYTSVFDFGVYLFLPEKLESKFPVLIAYTTPIFNTKKKTLFRIGLFLRGTDIIAIRLPSYTLEKIVGEEKVKQGEPDFYYWDRKEQYLKDMNRRNVVNEPRL